MIMDRFIGFGGRKFLLQKIHFRYKSTIKWHQPNGHDTGIQIYNCVARQKVPLIIRNKNVVTWYTCGPTVYSSAHIGHASCYMKQDILQRILRQYFKLNLITAMNVTDIDDKIILKANEQNEPWNNLAKRYETEFWNDMSKLDIIKPNITVRVSDFIPEIIKFIEQLLQSNMAYATVDGSVYFDVSAYPNYAKLQNINTEQMDNEPNVHKRSSKDFALWKAAKPNEPFWEAQWGRGRPGWHIECSTLASFIFGSQIDFHSGGLDLRYPHHENEEAQSCAHHKCDQWVNYWLHVGQLHVTGQVDKMSKSLKNTISIEEMLSKYSAEQFRMACIQSNWYNRMDYSDEAMIGAGNVLKKFREFSSNIDAYVKGFKSRVPFASVDVYTKISEINNKIDAALKDNLNTAKSIDHLFELVGFANKILVGSTSSDLYQSSDIGVIKALSNFVEDHLRVLGFELSGEEHGEDAQESRTSQFNELINELVQIRSEIRNDAFSSKSKDLFKHCDSIRMLLKRNNVDVKDHGKLSSWSFSEVKK